MRFLHDPLTSYVVDGGLELGLINPLSHVMATCFPYELYNEVGLDLFGMADGSVNVSYQQIETTYLNFADSLNVSGKAYIKDDLKRTTRAYIGFISDQLSCSLASVAIGMLPKIPKNELSIMALDLDGVSSFSERHEGELIRLRMTNDILRGMQNPSDVLHQTNIDRLAYLCFSNNYDLYTTVTKSIFDADASHTEILKYEKSLLNRPSEIALRKFIGTKNRISSLRRAQNRVRKAITRASNLFNMIPNGGNMLNAFLSEQEVFVEGKIFNYGFRKTQSLMRDASHAAHIPYRFSVYDKLNNELLSELCVGFRNQPTLDQLFSMIIHIHAGKETEERILCAANPLNVRTASKSNSEFEKYFRKLKMTNDSQHDIAKKYEKGELEIEYDQLRSLIKWAAKGQVISSISNMVDNTLFSREITQLKEEHIRTSPSRESVTHIRPRLISLVGIQPLISGLKSK